MGRSHALGLARAGFTVLAVDLSEVALDALVARASEDTLDLRPMVADVCSERGAWAIAERLAEEFGRIDVLVCNVGGALGAEHFGETSLDLWERTLRLNLTSQFLSIRAVLPMMQAQGAGRIVTIASSAVSSGITAALYRGERAANLVPYVAAKGGVVAMTRALARELGPWGITVNAVAPGFTPTERVRARFPEAAMARFMADQAIGRLQSPADATGAVVFLASVEATFITGQVIRVDGGGSMG